MKEHIVGDITLGREIQKKFWNAGLFVEVLWGVPDAASLLFDYVRLQGLFVTPDIPDIHIRAWHLKFVGHNDIMSQLGWSSVVWTGPLTGNQQLELSNDIKTARLSSFAPFVAKIQSKVLSDQL